MATESGNGDRDTELATAVHTVLAILTDLRSDAPAPALRERIRLVQWLRHQLGDVEALLVGADARRGAAPAATTGTPVR